MSGKCFERLALLLLGVGLLGAGFGLLAARQAEEKKAGLRPRVSLEQGLENYRAALEQTMVLLQTGRLKTGSN